MKINKFISNIVLIITYFIFFGEMIIFVVLGHNLIAKKKHLEKAA